MARLLRQCYSSSVLFSWTNLGAPSIFLQSTRFSRFSVSTHTVLFSLNDLLPCALNQGRFWCHFVGLCAVNVIYTFCQSLIITFSGLSSNFWVILAITNVIDIVVESIFRNSLRSFFSAPRLHYAASYGARGEHL